MSNNRPSGSANRPDVPKIDWRRTGGPWFGNQLMTLTLDGRSARLRLEQARARRGAPARLRTVMETGLTD